MKDLFEMIEEAKQYGDSITVSITTESVSSVHDLTVAIHDVCRKLREGYIAGDVDGAITFSVKLED